jgi:hypothetical protein
MVVPADDGGRVMFRRFQAHTNGRRRSRVPRWLVPAALLAIAGSVMTGPADSYSAGRPPAGQAAARSLDATTIAHLHLVKVEGSELVEEGPVTGALHGSMQAQLKTGVTFTGSFITHTSSGLIKGHGSATPHGTGRYQSFSGTFIVTGGTNHYAHISGRAGLYGVFDRRTDSVIVQTTGKLSY